MQTGDRVYYNHTNQQGMVTKFPAVILQADADDIRIRIGRLNVTTQKIETAVYGVAKDTLSPRNSKCNYEEDLLGADFSNE